MKKLICLMMALLLLTGSFALAETLGNGESDSVEASLSVPDLSPTVSVEVDWGDMEFAYTQAGWNPNTMTQTGVTGINPVNDSNHVSVRNYSNVDVTVICSLSDVLSGVTGSVDDSGSDAAQYLPACTDGSNAPSHRFTVTFTPGESFNPKELASSVKLATVTVLVQAIS